MSADSRDTGIPQSEGEGFTETRVEAEENSQASTESNILVVSCELTTGNVFVTQRSNHEIKYDQMEGNETLQSREGNVDTCILSEGNNHPVANNTIPGLNKDKQIEESSTECLLTDIVNAVGVSTVDHRLQEESSVEQHGELTAVSQAEAEDVGESAEERLAVEHQEGITALNHCLTHQNNESIELRSNLVVDQAGIVDENDENLLTGIANDGLPDQTSQFVDISSENPPQDMEISSDFGNVMVNTLNLLPQHRKDPKVYACNYCIKTFSQPHQIVRHERMHTGEKPYICEICGKGCSQKGDLVRHKRKHTGERPYKCDLCDKAYFKSADLKYHKRKHTGEKPYKCTLCDKAFTGLTTLRYHARTHSGEKPYECETCKKTFAQPGSLKLHKTTHSTEKPFECDLCEKKYSSPISLKNHKSTHAGEKTYRSYQCEICNKRLSHLSSLICHRRTHTGEKPFKCDQCDKAYSQSFDLKRHKETHSGLRSYKCEVCNKAFFWAVNLREHRKQHDDDKPFKCDMCDKTFSWSSALGHHKRQHNGEKPFKCETCGKTFAATGYLNRHIKNKHAANATEETDQSESKKDTPPADDKTITE